MHAAATASLLHLKASETAGLGYRHRNRKATGLRIAADILCHAHDEIQIILYMK